MVGRSLAALAVLLLVAVGGFLLLGRFFFAPLPGEGALLNPERRSPPSSFVLDEAVPDGGERPVDAAFVELGRDAFYRETFGNEHFLSDVMGLLDGAIGPWQVARAVLELGGRGTSDLQVRLRRDAVVGDRTIPAGTLIGTGLDVPRGRFAPLGIKTFYDRGRLRAGVTCALCHATVDPATGRVVEGAPNADLNVGLLLALASNSAAYFTHTTLPSLAEFASDGTGTVRGRDGETHHLPDPDRLEAAVDAMLGAWPPGSFDSTVDLVNNPSDIPDSFTAHDHPFGWSGFAQLGPFRGSTVLSNNVHALNADALAQAETAPAVFGIDTELYLATLLRRAANPAYRFDPAGDRAPSAVFAAVDPDPDSPGVVTVAKLPTFPRGSYTATESTLASLPGYPVWEHLNAISAFQETLLPPASPPLPPAQAALGRETFRAAGCEGCHAGPGSTNNRVLPVEEVGTQPSRARALAGIEENLAPPMLYHLGTPFPLPTEARAVEISLDDDRQHQLDLAWAHGGTAGGYKVKGLVGLAWSAPYLHDGAVAVGPDAERQLGLPGTLYAGVVPDPANSLRALVDRELRGRVVEANRGSSRARTSHTEGIGHARWVDAAAGYTPEQQEALVAYLLSLARPAAAPAGG